jgi:hypothetical protein
MIKEVILESIHDRSYGDIVFQTTSLESAEMIHCDICEKPTSKPIKIDANEHVCHDCVYSGRVREHYAALLGTDREELISLMFRIYQEVAIQK